MKESKVKKVFKDPIAVRDQKPTYKPKNGESAGWDCRGPDYDERTGPFIKAYTDYGQGHKNPIGHEGNAKETADTYPSGVKITILDM